MTFSRYFCRCFDKHTAHLEQPDYSETVREHRLLMQDADTEAEFDVIADRSKKAWLKAKEPVFVDKTAHMMTGVNKFWFKSASGVHRITTSMQGNERGHREDHRHSDQQTNHAQVRIFDFALL